MSHLLLFDIGNTNTHVGLCPEATEPASRASRPARSIAAVARRIRRHIDLPTRSWFDRGAARTAQDFAGTRRISGAVICSVVPDATPIVAQFVTKTFGCAHLVLGPLNVQGIGIDYPRPATIGPDRLANAVAVRHHFGAPAVVVDFGTAVTFDVVDRHASYVGGIIAPGLAAMTDYLHEKTALLPRIRIREVSAIIGRNTEQAMLIGAVHGYRGLIRGLIQELKKELAARRLPVIATGGYAALLSAKIPEITSVEPLLTLEGLRLCWTPPP